MLNVLVSYAYASPPMIEAIRETQARGIPRRLLLDSGAFTAWTTGKRVDLLTYAGFVRDALEQEWVWKYFTLDVIGDYERTRSNYEHLRQLGLEPLPIFTPGTPESLLEEYYEQNHLVGYGGINAYHHRQRAGYIKYCMRVAKGRDVHLLGMTSITELLKHRPYMCDSASWATVAQYGELNLYVHGKRSKRWTRTDFLQKPADDTLRLIRWYGFDPYVFNKHAAWHSQDSPSRQLALASAVCQALDIERTIGTKVFIAVKDHQQLTMVLKAYERVHDKGRPPR